MLCPRCGFDASRDYEKYPTFGIVGNDPAISALREEQDLAQKAAELEKQQLLDRVAELERQVSSMMETNRLLLEKLTAPDSRTVTPASSPVPTPAKPAVTRKRNILRSDLASGEYNLQKIKDCPVFGSSIKRKEIEFITFVDTVANAPLTAWDVSADGDGSVLAWTHGFRKKNYLYIGAEGGIDGVESCKKLFAGYENLRRIDFGQNFHTTNVRDMSFMFFDCFALSSLDLSSFDTSGVQDMCCMFCGCSALTDLDLGSFNTANVKNMSNMFSGCSDLTTLEIGSFRTANVRNMKGMFFACENLPSLDLEGFSTANVTDMSEMFADCASLTTLDLSSFRTANVTDMSEMFTECASLTTLNLRSFDTSRVQNMKEMFQYCSRLTALDLSSFNTSNVKNMDGMFWGCELLHSLDLNLAQASQADKSFMFTNCPAETEYWHLLH